MRSGGRSTSIILIITNGYTIACFVYKLVAMQVKIV